MAVVTQFQFRRGTAAEWTSANPTLAAGELGFETDTGKAKIGNGATAWNSLAYNISGVSGDIEGVTAGTGLTGGGTSGTVTVSLDTSSVYVVPSQAGQAGKYLSTDGTSASWTTVAGDIEGVTAGTGLTGGGTSGTVSLAIDSTVTTLTGTQTLTNKTLTAPVITLATNAQTASYSLVLSDANKVVEMNVASGNNLTVPLNSSHAFPVGSTVTILQTGTGQTTIVATGGVTVNGTPGLKLRAQWSSATLIKRATDTWVAIGDLSA